MKLFHYKTINPTGVWKLCGEECGYRLFESEKPKAIAERLICQVFGPKEMLRKIFYYLPYYYRGKNNLQNRIEVYYREWL